METDLEACRASNIKILHQGAKSPPTKKRRSFALFFYVCLQFFPLSPVTLWDSCVSMIGKADIEGSKSNVAMNAWLHVSWSTEAPGPTVGWHEGPAIGGSGYTIRAENQNMHTHMGCDKTTCDSEREMKEREKERKRERRTSTEANSRPLPHPQQLLQQKLATNDMHS